MALGARAGDVLTLFLRQGLALTATRIALGIGIAAAITRVMSALTALLAAYLPARRASRVNPIIALRADM